MKKISTELKHIHFPRIGQRIVKTAVAVFLCLLVGYLRGFEAANMSAESCITAIICIQPYMKDSGWSAINRFIGSLIGSAWSLLFLMFLIDFPVFTENRIVLYALMAVGVIVALYITILMKLPDASGVSAIIFICVVISFPAVNEPLYNAFLRMVDVLIGSAIALLVNIFRLPRRKNKEDVYFVSAKDLVPDRFASIPASVFFRLNYLINEGAKIVMVSEHAPAFFTLQLSAAQLNTPMIVMDGAAIYDAAQNEFLYMETIPPEITENIRKRLDTIGCSYFIYTIHKNKLCIFHQGKITEQEQVIYDRMKSSPYRSYLEGEIYEAEEIVYFKLIATDGMITGMQAALKDLISQGGIRTEIRPQASADGISGLYIYSDEADIDHAKNVMMWMLREKNPDCIPVEVVSKTPYRSETDALRLLRRIGRMYEPVAFLPRRRPKKNSQPE